jgi:hypothetical protein
MNQHSHNRTAPSVYDEPIPHSLPASLVENNRERSEEENVSELEKDLLLAFKKQDKSLSLASGTGDIRLKELRYGSPLRSHDQAEEEQQQQEMNLETRR